MVVVAGAEGLLHLAVVVVVVVVIIIVVVFFFKAGGDAKAKTVNVLPSSVRL